MMGGGAMDLEIKRLLYWMLHELEMENYIKARLIDNAIVNMIVAKNKSEVD
jgi:hypothetical protein